MKKTTLEVHWHQGFVNFETIFVYFESRAVNHSAVLRIQAVTVCPIRCLKARLKVL